ncbi:hypothetical protein D3C75_634130 [compost metagenome]
MSSLMAQIAAQVLKEAELASVTELDMHADKPADNGIDHPECATPKDIISALETSVEFHIGHGNEFKESNKEEEAKFEFSCAETMQEILVLLRKGDEKHHKLASLAAFSAKNSIQNKIPSNVMKFLVPSVSGKKALKEFFMDRMLSKVQLDEGIVMLAEDVFNLIQSSVDTAKSHNPQDPKSEQAFRNAAHYMGLLVSFMQVDKQTNTSGEEELRSYVPVGTMYRNEVQQSLDKFATFIKNRGNDLDFGRFDPIAIANQYQQFLLKGGAEQWDSVGQQLVAYFKQREGSINNQAEQPQLSAHDNYEMRAKAEQQAQQAPR